MKRPFFLESDKTLKLFKKERKKAIMPHSIYWILTLTRRYREEPRRRAKIKLTKPLIVKTSNLELWG